MLARFICPDNEQIDVAGCLKRCRQGERCLTLPTLHVLSQDREWDGRPHVTSLLNGTMHEYLTLTKDYAVNPRGSAFALLGSSHHKLLEGGGDWLSEVDVSNRLYHGRLDLVEPAGNGSYVLVDAKTWGSYKVAKALGLVKQGKTWMVDPETADMFEPEMQLNMYRILWGQLARSKLKRSYPIARMKLQVTVRDGGLSVAASRGITELIYNIPVRRLPDMLVLRYFGHKRRALLKALQSGWDEVCSEQECWSGNRCKSYCNVAEFCIKGRMYKMREV